MTRAILAALLAGVFDGLNADPLTLALVRRISCNVFSELLPNKVSRNDLKL